MKINSVLQRSMAVLVLLVIVLMAACSQPTETEAPVADEPASGDAVVLDGATLLEQRCIGCHDLERTTSKNKTEAGWTQTVERMVNKGTTLSAEEQTVLIEYLVETYGPATE